MVWRRVFRCGEARSVGVWQRSAGLASHGAFSRGLAGSGMVWQVWFVMDGRGKAWWVTVSYGRFGK